MVVSGGGLKAVMVVVVSGRGEGPLCCVSSIRGTGLVLVGMVVVCLYVCVCVCLCVSLRF